MSNWRTERQSHSPLHIHNQSARNGKHWSIGYSLNLSNQLTQTCRTLDGACVWSAADIEYVMRYTHNADAEGGLGLCQLLFVDLERTRSIVVQCSAPIFVSVNTKYTSGSMSLRQHIGRSWRTSAAAVSNFCIIYLSCRGSQGYSPRLDQTVVYLSKWSLWQWQ